MGCEVCDRLLHVVVVDDLWLAWKLTVLVERSCSLLKLLMHREVGVLLPRGLVLKKYLIFGSTFSSALLFWWLLDFFIDSGNKFRLLLRRLLQPSSSPSDSNNVVFPT